MSVQRALTILTQGHLYGVATSPLTRGYITATPTSPGPVIQKFFFDSVELVAPNIVRARFNDVPVTSGSSPTRADVVSNWTLQGPSGPLAIQLASKFIGDPEVIDLHLYQPLTVGSYQLTVAPTVMGSDPVTISPPLTIAFDLAIVEQDRISRGAVNNPSTVGAPSTVENPSSACEDLLQRLINPAFRGKKNWSGLLAGIAAGDCIVREQAEAALDQLFLASASGKYLTTRAADRGVGRPSKMGIGDDLFRDLAISVINSKLTQEAFLEMLEVFYGTDAVSAFAEFGPEVYVLFDGAELDFTLDGQFQVKATLTRSDFSILRRATALEVAAAVTRAIEEQQSASGGYATSHFDPQTGMRRLRVYSGSRGLHSSVVINPSTAAIALQPPTNLFPPPDILPPLPTWTVSVLPGGRARYDVEANSLISLDQVVAGDYLVVLGYEFDVGNRGAFLVEDVSFSYAGAILTQYVDVTNPDAVGETVGQLRADSAQFFRQTRRTTYDFIGYVTVAQSQGDALVSLPVTTRAVNRHAKSAAYLQPAPGFEVTAVSRDRSGTTTLTTSAPSGLAPGDQLIIDGIDPDLSQPAGSGGSPSGAFDGSGTADGSTQLQPTTSWNTSTTFEGADFKNIKDLDGDVWFVGGNTYSNSGIPTALAQVAAFRILSETVDAALNCQTSYRWTKGVLSNHYSVGTALTLAQDVVNRNRVIVAGGYVNTPWGPPVGSVTIEASAKLVKKLTTTPWFEVTAAGTLATPVAEAAGAWISSTNKVMLTGGVDEYNRAVAVVQEGLTSWSNDGGSLKVARCQHAALPLDASHAIVIGGRQPANNSARTGVFTSWDFEEPSAGTFSGPVGVSRSTNTALAGKMGLGLHLSVASTSVGGGAQTTLNSDLLGGWTICGWMTAGTGTVLRNGVVTWTAQADNTLIAFGVDTTDDKFFVRWGQSAIHNTITKKTAATRTQLMGPDYNAPYPRYHHFAITKTVSGPNATFTLYINGLQAGQWTDLKPDGGGSGLWSFGQADSNSPSIAAYTGCIDAVGFSTTVLTAADVAAQYRAEIGVVYENPNDDTASPVGRVLNSCEIVEATTGTSKLTGPMSDARFAAAVVQLPDGRIVVAGGCGYNPSSPPDPSTPQRAMELSSAEIYDPTVGIWTPLPPMRDPHSYCSAGYVAAENRVYVSGGFSSRILEYLDLTDMTWHVSSTYPLLGEKAHGGGGVAGTRTVVLAGGAVENTTNPHPVYDTMTAGPLDYTTPAAAETWAAGGIDGLQTAVDGTSGTTVKLKSRAEVTASATAVVTPSKAAPAVVGMPGPYVFDPRGGVGISAIAGTLSAALHEGVKYGSLQLQTNEALLFPDAPGYLIIDFGMSKQVGPVRYLGRLNASALRLDAGFSWTAESVVGTEVRLLDSRSGFVPEDPTAVGSFYVTASNAGLAGAKKFLADISAAGIDLRVTVRYPNDRGLGGEGFPTQGSPKLSSIVEVFGSDDLDAELPELRAE